MIDRVTSWVRRREGRADGSTETIGPVTIEYERRVPAGSVGWWLVHRDILAALAAPGQCPRAFEAAQALVDAAVADGTWQTAAVAAAVTPACGCFRATTSWVTTGPFHAHAMREPPVTWWGESHVSGCRRLQAAVDAIAGCRAAVAR